MKRTKPGSIPDDMRKAALGKGFPTLQAARVLQEILPPALERFLEKNKDYGDAAVHLGAKGQFADMNRKYWKIKAELWDGKRLESEPIEEVLEDMIGHCLLTLLFLRDEQKASPGPGLDWGHPVDFEEED